MSSVNWHFFSHQLDTRIKDQQQTNINEYLIVFEMQGAQDYEKKMQQEAKKQQEQEMRQSILTQILTPEARDRLVKIKLVKPQKVVTIQNALITAAQQGKLRNRISEQELVSMLESQTKTQSKVTFKRRGIDDEW